MLKTAALKNRRSTSTKVVFPTVPSLTASPIRMILRQVQGHHDILTLEFPTVSNRWFNTLTTGIPIHFYWTQNRVRKDWYGYVSHVSKEVMSQRENTMQIVCVSSSFVLKERATRVFSNTTVTDAIKKIAKEFEFNLVIDDHPRIFNQLTMSGHSYWEWIQEQAKKIGYVAYVDEMTLHFRPIDKVIDTTIKSCPVLSIYSPQVPYAANLLDGTLDYIKVIKGEHVESPNSLRSIKKVSGIDPFTGEIVSAKSNPNTVGFNLRSNSSEPLFNEYRYDNVVDSAKSAEYSAKASAELGRFNIPAEITGQGDCRLYPFKSFYVDRTGDQTDGFWIVKSITHAFGKNGQYSMDMRAVTDGLNKSPVTTYRPSVGSLVGTIDARELLGSGKLSLGPDQVTLKNMRNVLIESAQNFITTETRWVSR